MASLSIPRRRLGRTELSIPVVPFGTLGFSNQSWRQSLRRGTLLRGFNA